MRPFIVVIALVCFSANTVLGQPAAKPPPAYVGELIIVGNTVTQDRVIRQAVGLIPGHVLNYPELRLAERNLKRLGIFNTDPKKGSVLSVTVLDSPGPFKDVLVKVQEMPTGMLLLTAGIAPSGRVVIRLVVEEWNFDPCRWPASMADLAEGRAFRGAGQKFRLEVKCGR